MLHLLLSQSGKFRAERAYSGTLRLYKDTALFKSLQGLYIESADAYLNDLTLLTGGGLSFPAGRLDIHDEYFV